MSQNDQKHPQASNDRIVVDRLFKNGSSDLNLAELARLLIRYRNFTGARDIQEDLHKLLQEWDLTEEQLYETTRKLHAEGKVYRNKQEDRDDWS
ncbi:MAG: DUF3288 family protein [Prochloraceae cyanobacterium]